MLEWLTTRLNGGRRAQPAVPQPSGTTPARLVSDPDERASEPPTRGEAYRNSIVLDVRNRYGSVEHYYHFLFGFLAPILLQPASELSEPQIIRSCGVLDDHIRALNLPQLTIVPKSEWTSLLAGQHRRRILCGLDDPAAFDRPTLERFKDVVLDRLSVEHTAPTERILVIGRGRSPDFYQSDASEIKASANIRRSVPNLSDICAAIEQRGRAVLHAELEAERFHAQVRLFANTRTIIAQHGAALANMLWMAPGGTVIEINPKAGSGDLFKDAFAKLAHCCGHNYVAVAQTSPHARVEPELVLDAIGL